MDIETQKLEIYDLSEKIGMIMHEKNSAVGINALIWVLANVVVQVSHPEECAGVCSKVILDFIKAIEVLKDLEGEHGSLH